MVVVGGFKFPVGALVDVELDVSDVRLLLHADGTQGSTSFPDSSLNSVAITAFSASVETSGPKFGTGSALFSLPNPQLRAAGTEAYFKDLHGGTQAWSFEGFLKPDPAAAIQSIFITGYTADGPGVALYLEPDDTVRLIVLDADGDQIVNGNTVATVNRSEWNLVTVAASPLKSLYYVAVNEAAPLLVPYGAGYSTANTADALRFGIQANAGNKYEGEMDEIRIAYGERPDLQIAHRIPESPFVDP